MISEALGHFSFKTTEIYLHSFEHKQRAELSKHLLEPGDGCMLGMNGIDAKFSVGKLFGASPSFLQPYPMAAADIQQSASIGKDGAAEMVS
jgi:hypothetical protein